MPEAAAVESSMPELSLDEGRLWCESIERRCGVYFPESQWRHLRRRLWERMRPAGIASYAGYWRCLEREGRGGGEWEKLTEDLLNPETAFFRHQPSHDALKPVLQGWRRDRTPCAIWSAGCSTGEEAYSLAMASQALTGAADVMGTDLNRTVLGRAAAGVYSERQAATVPPDWRTRFLAPAPGAGLVEVAPVLRAGVRFQPFHLLEPGTYPRREFDVIFCFNVLIYFRPPARQEALAGLLGRLKPGGLLFLAPGEGVGVPLCGAGPAHRDGAYILRRAA